jgi:hypothetical protein
VQEQNEHGKQEESNNHPQGNQVQLGPPGGINPNLAGGAPGGQIQAVNIGSFLKKKTQNRQTNY